MLPGVLYLTGAVTTVAPQTGLVSVLAPWIGGASGVPVAISPPGYTSPLAVWMGGASGSPVIPIQAGFVSPLGLWFGGISGFPEAPPPPQPLVGGKQHKKYEKPKEIPVESSHLQTVVFNKDTGEMKIKFKTGETYSYTNVPQKDFDKLVKAKSHGKFLHKNIKGKYSYNKIGF